MQIPEAKLDEFVTLYQNRFGIVLGRGEALEKATKFLNFMRVVVGPLTEHENENVYEKRKTN